MKTPEVLNSKIKKIRIELPHYSFSHSSSGDSPHAFIGRVRTKEKLKKVIEDSPDEPGVYLIAGNRGVGKTSLISEIIKETSLNAKSGFSENFRYLVLLFLAVAGVQFCLEEFGITKMYPIILGVTSFLIFVLSFFLLCLSNTYRRKFPKKTSWIKYIKDGIISARKSTQIVLKTILVVSFAQIASLIPCITPTIAFLGSLVIVLGYNLLFRFVKLKNSFLSSVKNYIKNHNRLYLRINFGHKLKDEKDILRLVTRTLSTEYQKYRYSFWRMLPWRALAFGLLFLFAHLFSDIAKQELTNLETIFLPALDQLVKRFYPSINYIFLLSFISMYLFCILLFRCNFITHFFVTHRIIMRRLKRLNSDITHSTERENSINVNSGSIGSKIGTRTRKTRNVADAREIEKELQDILNDMQQIPVLMCRPNIVIVFDELDKVEPGDASLEKETPQTKASMFSINATRERQTEILRILSNMKYFLSTARAKFIFIAGREMFDIHLADVSERNNYIGSIFNAVIYVPSFLVDHPTGKKLLPQESGITSLPEEFVCRRLIPHDYPVKSYDLKHYRKYLEKEIFREEAQNKETDFQEEKIHKIIAVLQQFIIYLAHLSKGAPKKMMQLFESFVEIHIEKDENKNTLFVQRYHSSRHFLSFNYYKQYTLGIVAYLITPIFYRLSESNIKEHSDKLLVSALRFVDFVFKFHKHPFSYKHLDISPEMLEVNRAPELKSVAADLLNYLSQVHINKLNFSFSEYKFDSLIANEIFAMAKTDDVFSALFSFSLDELLPLKKHYLDLLEKMEKKYRDEKDGKISTKYIDAISSLQAVLGDLYYYDDGLEEAEAYYKSSVQAFRENKGNGEITLGQLYVYIRSMLRLGIIYEKRKQYDFAYLTYGELCKRIFERRDIATIITSPPLDLEKISSCTYDMLFERTAYEGLRMLYLPFVAKLQILEQSHIGGIARNHLELFDKEFKTLNSIIHNKEKKILEVEFHLLVADILYYKNSDLKDLSEMKCKKGKKNCSCTVCDYYLKALSTLLNKSDLNKPGKNTIKELLRESIERIEDNYNMKLCTILARIFSHWGNVFFSCDSRDQEDKCGCYICDAKDCNTNNLASILEKYIKYVDSESENREVLLDHFNSNADFTKMEIAFAMYAISLHAFRKANLHKRFAYQIYKMLCLFKYYGIYKCEKSQGYIKQLSKKSIDYLWRANENLNVYELNKRKKDFGKETIEDKDKILLQYLLVDSEITRIRMLVKELELKFVLNKTPKEPKNLKEFYDIRITSPYRINYSIVGRIYRLRLKSIVNYEAYRMLINDDSIPEEQLEIERILKPGNCDQIAREIFGKYFEIKENKVNIIDIFENLIAESIYCLTDIAQLLETMDETYLFPHSFLGSIHKHLSFWIRLYETYEIYIKEKPEIGKNSQIKEYLKKYLDEEWREQLSGHRENKKALLHYYKCLEMHNEGRAYHNMIDSMCYVRDDYNDRSYHFNIAEERHLIANGKIRDKIDEIKNLYENSKLYDIDNYFTPPPNKEDTQ